MDTGKNSTGSVPSPKSGDYLWDRSGEPDPEIQKLESLLANVSPESKRAVFTLTS